MMSDTDSVLGLNIQDGERQQNLKKRDGKSLLFQSTLETLFLVVVKYYIFYYCFNLLEEV